MNKIYQIQTIIESCIEHLKKEYPEFPFGFICKQCAEYLQKQLLEAGINTDLCRGNILLSNIRYSSNGRPDIVNDHYWLTVMINRRTHILDITRHQFYGDDDPLELLPLKKYKKEYFEWLHIPKWVDRRLNAMLRENSY